MTFIGNNMFCLFEILFCIMVLWSIISFYRNITSVISKYYTFCTICPKHFFHLFEIIFRFNETLFCISMKLSTEQGGVGYWVALSITSRWLIYLSTSINSFFPKTSLLAIQCFPGSTHRDVCSPTLILRYKTDKQEAMAY